MGTSLQTLDLPNVKDRVKAAALRFRAYVQGKPLVEAYQSRLQFLIKKFGKKARYPLKKEIEEYLSSADKELVEIKKILDSSGDPKASEDFKVFTQQINHYHAFLKTEILPHARVDARLPAELYRWQLHQHGVDWNENEAITIGKREYAKGEKEFQSLLKQVVALRKMKVKSAPDVMAELRKEQVTNKAEVEKLFRAEITRQIEGVKKEDRFPSLDKDVDIQMMSAEESQQEPYAHVNPPPLAFTSGEPVTFWIPWLEKGAFSVPDFEFKAAIPVLVSHEVRPGHELYFNWVIDHGTTMLRARYGFSVPTVEAWAFYAEDEMVKGLPVESKLVWAQMKQWRAARMFLDPGLHLGKISDVDAVKFLVEEIGLSRELAEQEVRRYLESDPSVAVAYAYGHLKLLELKEKTQKRMGKEFNERCFNEFILNNALVPIQWLQDYIGKEMRCPKAAPKWQDLASVSTFLH